MTSSKNDAADISSAPSREIHVEKEGTVVLRIESPHQSRRGNRVVMLLLLLSILLNVWYIGIYPSLYQPPRIPEVHLLGTKGAADRIAVINFTGTISPPFTERWLRQIEKAAEDSSVKGVILAIDSPGGFVADSHQIYRQLQTLAEKKPVYAAMKRIAASGGYYIAMVSGQKAGSSLNRRPGQVRSGSLCRDTMQRNWHPESG
ncbi:MAG: ATP-dependent Clp protease proteolytic subunit [Planctomycetaceae bacterium]